MGPEWIIEYLDGKVWKKCLGQYSGRAAKERIVFLRSLFPDREYRIRQVKKQKCQPLAK